MSKHTQAPWGVNGDDCNNIGNLCGVWIAKVDPSTPDGFDGRIAQAFVNCQVNTDEQCRANALLIAASPELLIAAELVLKSFAYAPGGAPEWYEAARVAHAKATVGAA